MSNDNNEQIELLREILKWVRFAGSNQVKGVLVSTLDSDKKRLAYQLSDGKNASRAIAEQAGVDASTAQDWWKEWTLLGLGEGIPVAGGGTRFKKSFDIKMYGMSVPAVKTKNNAAQPAAVSAPAEAGGTENA